MVKIEQRPPGELARARRYSLRGALAACWAVGCWLALSTSSSGGAPTAREYQLKAAFLFNFTKFVEWNARSFGGLDDPIIIGVLGSAPLMEELDRAVQHRRVNGREIMVKRMQGQTGATGVHLLFVGATEDERLGDLREALKGSNALTVGESDTFARWGGAITFIVDGDKVRFDINITAAEQASVKISAQLQKLARSVRR